MFRCDVERFRRIPGDVTDTCGRAIMGCPHFLWSRNRTERDPFCTTNNWINSETLVSLEINILIISPCNKAVLKGNEDKNNWFCDYYIIDSDNCLSRLVYLHWFKWMLFVFSTTDPDTENKRSHGTVAAGDNKYFLATRYFLELFLWSIFS